MKSPVHIVWRRPSPEKPCTWMILYAAGDVSRIHSGIREGVIGIALSLGRRVIVHRKDGAVDFVLEPENLSRFHFLMAVVALSFLTLVVVAVGAVILLARLLF